VPCARPIALAITAILSAGCSMNPVVARMESGRPLDGRWISPDAYAAFLQGTLLEERGEDAKARTAYELALAEDPKAAGIWARLGAVLCDTDTARASAAFERATGLDPELADPWLARAECALRQKRGREARDSALRAAALSPDDIEASLVVVEALDLSGDPERAARWLTALTLLHPGAPDVQRALLERAEHRGDRATMARAEQHLQRLQGDPGAPGSPRDALADMDFALGLGDATAARDAQVRAHVPSSELSLHAVSMGQNALATETASRVLAAEPGNVDARVAGLAAADLAQDEASLKKALQPLPRDRTRLGATAARLLRDLLARRAGPDAAAAWSGAPSPGSR